MGVFENLTQFLAGPNILAKIVRVLFIIMVFSIIKKVVNKIFDKNIENRIITEKHKYKTRTVMSLIKSALNILIYFLATTFILNAFNINTSSIIAVAGVGGMAIAFASKSLIEDIISGAIILFEDQFNIGDLVTIGDITATVKSVGIRITTLEDIDGREIIIPNGEIHKVINYSINNMRAFVTVYISDNKPYKLVEEALQIACNNVYEENNLTEIPKILGIDKLDVEGYQVAIAVKVSNGIQWEIQRKLRKEIVNELQKADISFSRLLKG